MAYRDTIAATSGAVAAWDFDESPGATTAADYISGTYPLTYRGTNTLGVGGLASGSAFSMAGAGGADMASSPATGDCTMEAWARWSDRTATEQCVFNNGNGSNGYGLIANGNSTTSGNYHVLRELLAWHDTGVRVPDDLHHVALTRAGGTYQFYLDGALRWSGSPGGPNAPSAFSVGRYTTGARTYRGTIDAAAIYGRVLTAAEVRAHFEAQDYPRRQGPDAAGLRPARSRLRRDHPSARGLIVACAFGDDPLARNLVDGRADSNGTAYAVVAGRHGPAIRTQRGSLSYSPAWDHPAVDRWSVTVELLLTVRSWPTASLWQSALWTQHSGISAFGDPTSLNLRFGHDAIAQACLNPQFGGSLRAVMLDRPIHLHYVSDASGQRVYLGGRLLGSGAAPPAGTFGRSYVAAEQGRQDAGIDADWHLYNLWNRPLTEAEVAARVADPWGLYRARRPPVALMAAAAPAAYVPAGNLGWVSGSPFTYLTG